MTHITMTDDQWAKKFRPIANHLGGNGCYGGFDPENEDAGCMFETYSEDLAYIQSVMKGEVDGLTAANVWTIMDGETPLPNEPFGQCLIDAGCEYDEDECNWTRNGELIAFDSIGEGFHLVNRQGYLITREPAEPGFMYSIYDNQIVADASMPLPANAPLP
ncbi:MAG: hypothetical protein Q8O64_14590 [Sideroxyarcus sp.]|nr:hypothetical protein [Sideroxyarcus sp.]